MLHNDTLLTQMKILNVTENSSFFLIGTYKVPSFPFQSSTIITLFECSGIVFQGDLVMQCDQLFEFLTKLSVTANKQNAIKVVQGR